MNAKKEIRVLCPRIYTEVSQGHPESARKWWNAIRVMSDCANLLIYADWYSIEETDCGEVFVEDADYRWQYVTEFVIRPFRKGCTRLSDFLTATLGKHYGNIKNS